MKSFEAVVEEVVAEAANAATLVLAPREPVEYRAGQFVSIDPHQFRALGPLIADLEHRKGKKELVRAYSLSSSPHQARLAITVKVEAYDPKTHPYPPLLSPLLTFGVRPGEVLQLMGCSGLYNLAPDLEARCQHVLHLVAGSGIVPNLSLLQWDLETRAHLKHTLITSNKTAADILFRARLDELQRRHPQRLTVIHALTREPNAVEHGLGYHAGRVTLELLRAHLGDPATVECYCCGPAITMGERKRALAEGGTPAPRFLETVVAMLKELGVERRRIHQESFA